MRLHVAIPIMFAATIIARSVPNSNEDKNDPLNCTSFGKGCQFKLDVLTGTFRCSCTNNPNNLPDLAWFYTETNYGGIEYQGYGNYKTCQNLPFAWDKKTRSMKSNLDPSVICCVFTGSNCNKEGRHWTSVDATVQEFQGWYALGVESYMCNLWVDETSTCDGL
ncbi:hypothetical protein BKA61DRAFT_681294 [Leptodontidium sp. MPI-SDFR-AT-0119]|nr:hypothetical protein BKA61DRAFT_681294 [Leptodontidium sp. MPI-SDFR-AT-0119]